MHERTKLKKLFSTLGSRICFTIDIWTSIQNASYVGTIIMDNATTVNDVSISHLKDKKKALLFGGEFLHVRYSTHILNLIEKIVLVRYELH